MGSRRVRVAVISDQDVVRAGVETVLAAYADRVEVLGTETGEPVDVVVYDVLGLHDGDGRTLELALRRYPGRVLALGRDLQPGLAAQAVSLGAVATVSIGVSGAEMIETIEGVATGRFRDGSSADIENQAARAEQMGRDVSLTVREREVLALIVRGASNKEVASELYLTLNTVKSVIRTAYAKIGVQTRSQAVAWGMNHGFPSRGESQFTG